MLPPGVVKGGAAMQIRLGDAKSRATRDLDAARAADLTVDAYLEQLDDRLAAGLFARLGLPSPDPIPLLPVDHQVAQKLHACTWLDRNGENDRAHDLVDLQILIREEAPDLARVGSTARRLFDSRHAQAWPPTVTAHDQWDTLYAVAAEGLDVIDTVEEAIGWANSLVARIDAASSGR